MRLVWPDEETMPKKRKQTRVDAEVPAPEAEPADGPVQTAEEEAAAAAVANQPTEAAQTAQDAAPAEAVGETADGQVEAPAVEAVGEDKEEADADEAPPIDLATLEAMLFSTHHPLTGQRLGELLSVTSQKAVKRAVQDLNKQYEDSGRTFRIEQVAGGYQMLSLPEYGDILKRLHQKESDAKLSKAALETLAIIAYKQPILRADVEAIRGVACGETIRSLMEKHLVNIAGRAEEPGRPILYGTTKRFLQLFGLNNLKDLPQSEALPKPKE
jgi:segregation and condensation protein B